MISWKVGSHILLEELDFGREEMKIWVGGLYCVGNFCGRGNKQIFDYLAESSLILPVGKTLNLSWFKFGGFPFLILNSKALTSMLAVLHNHQHFCHYINWSPLLWHQTLFFTTSPHTCYFLSWIICIASPLIILTVFLLNLVSCM